MACNECMEQYNEGIRVHEHVREELQKNVFELEHYLNDAKQELADLKQYLSTAETALNDYKELKQLVREYDRSLNGRIIASTLTHAFIDLREKVRQAIKE